ADVPDSPRRNEGLCWLFPPPGNRWSTISLHPAKTRETSGKQAPTRILSAPGCDATANLTGPKPLSLGHNQGQAPPLNNLVLQSYFRSTAHPVRPGLWTGSQGGNTRDRRLRVLDHQGIATSKLSARS